MKWLKNLIEKRLKTYLNSLVVLKSLESFSLSKETPNVLYIDVGQMPTSKATRYMNEMIETLRKNEKMSKYEFILIAKGR